MSDNIFYSWLYSFRFSPEIAYVTSWTPWGVWGNKHCGRTLTWLVQRCQHSQRVAAMTRMYTLPYFHRVMRGMCMPIIYVCCSITSQLNKAAFKLCNEWPQWHVSTLPYFYSTVHGMYIHLCGSIYGFTLLRRSEEFAMLSDTCAKWSNITSRTVTPLLEAIQNVSVRKRKGYLAIEAH
jgi:hypothetical protein